MECRHSADCTSFPNRGTYFNRFLLLMSIYKRGVGCIHSQKRGRCPRKTFWGTTRDPNTFAPHPHTNSWRCHWQGDMSFYGVNSFRICYVYDFQTFYGITGILKSLQKDRKYGICCMISKIMARILIRFSLDWTKYDPKIL